MERQTVPYPRSLYRSAFWIAALAITLFAASALRRVGVIVHGSSPLVHEEATEAPADWAALPSVARWQADNVLSGRDDSLFGSSVLSQATFGDVFVRYRVSQCDWSACRNGRQTLYDVSFGSLDEHGVPSFPIKLECISNEHRSCAPESFIVRSDGARFVLTMKDPDAQEIPIAAIVRMPVRVLAAWSTPAWSIDRALLLGVASVMFGFGAFALVWARRFYRPRGVLSWIPTEIHGEEVLVDPRARAAGSAYRDTEPLAPVHIYRGTLGLAAQRAELAARFACLSLVASVLVSLVGFLAY